MSIRPAVPTDLPAVQRLLRETWHATYDAIYGPPKVEAFSRDWHSIEGLARQLTQPQSVFLVAEQAGAVIATSFAYEMEPGLVRLSRLYVHPSAQTRGLGARLMQATLAPFGPMVRVRLDVEALNSKALRFYERHGFVQIGALDDIDPSSGSGTLVLQREIAA